MDELLGGTLGIALMLISLALALLWLLVPIAIFGIKPLLRDLIREQQLTNDALVGISKQIATVQSQRPPMS